MIRKPLSSSPRPATKTPGEIQFSQPDFDEADAQIVAEVVRSGRLSIGPYAAEFENRIAEFIGTKHAVAISSGTAALHVIMLALKIGPGDEVIVPSFTFAASVNAILYVGATPVLVDIEADTFNLDPADVRRKITPRTRGIMVVDVFGHPAEWGELRAIADEFNITLIGDCCEALGAEIAGERVGRHARASAFGFYPNKQITTGEGGMIVTDDDRLAAMAKSLRNQGRSAMGQWLDHENLGYNFRLDEMSAALGVSQLRRLDTILAKRARVAEEYNRRLAAFDWVILPATRPHVRRSWFVYVIRLATGRSRDAVMQTMAAQGIATRAYFSPIHAQPYLAKVAARVGELPMTNAVAAQTVALPFHPNLTADEVARVVAALEVAAQSNRLAS